ncbi:F0F1 ATP synthase subunit delta [Actinobacteria bacterium YIM 96077]|uniref:ATP synthase subunit delta n=1 Tax=Phytoactinopolyspora halophila TaxID=1981511 RepID=A0A329QR33_9ACTN|nr:F0F1 ATP synthase subunit delta [Phytoactinopolyspora halophila]AYY14275.1 F0F1 ATP synthase subunit delta [Actinobacteria bacterium YIM 96077]RAW14817.1 F0F1 ATP synthase subunit delta [Phytoactinopolyspora halophila]
MLGSSRNSFEAARVALAQGDTPVSLDMAAELMAVANGVAASSVLRNALSDSGSEPAARVALARSVFEGKVASATLDVVTDVVGRRWTSGRDLVDAIEALGFEAVFIVAEREGRLDAVEDELFRVDRTVASNGELRHALSDPTRDSAAHAELLDGLLAGKADERTVMLVHQVVQHPRGRQLGDALNALVEQSARRRERLLARIRVAAPLRPDQETRLTAALARIYQREVDLQVEVDPEVLGGVVVRVGDEVIDGSVAHRLEEIRRQLSA